MRLSVIVPATDDPPTLAQCRAALAATVGPDDEVIVVDQPPLLPPAAARNAGARQARGDVLVFVDADVAVHPDALDRVRDTLEQRPELAAVFGAYDDAPAVTSTVSAFRNLLHHFLHVNGAGPASTFWSGLGAVRRASFENVGGFDEERYRHPSIEDIELGARLAAAGARIELVPTIQGKHLKRWTLSNMLWTDFARRGVPWVELLLRTGRVPTALNLGWRHRLSALTALVIVLGAVLLQPVVAATGVLGLVVLNLDFYLLLARCQGPLRALAGVGLHGLHHLAAVMAVPAGAINHLRSGSRA